MKYLAIHNNPGGYSDKWIEYCEINSIPFKLVNCYNSSIVNELEDCFGLMWHWDHNHPATNLLAQQLSNMLAKEGKHVFPDFNTSWHFDDKIAQSFLLKSINAPIPETKVFFRKEEALDWIISAKKPLIFKLRRGAGSSNVFLVKSKSQAKKLIIKAFGKGFKNPTFKNLIKDKFRNKLKQNSFRSYASFFKSIVKYFKGSEEFYVSRERGYAYFQEFIPGNDHDIRIVVIGNKAFGIKRLIRKDDFRASGSGQIIHDISQIPLKCFETSFELNKSLKMQCVAFDYVFKNNDPVLLEISFGFSVKGYRDCSGYYTSDLKWHEGSFSPEYFIIEDFLKTYSK